MKTNTPNTIVSPASIPAAVAAATPPAATTEKKTSSNVNGDKKNAGNSSGSDIKSNKNNDNPKTNSRRASGNEIRSPTGESPRQTKRSDQRSKTKHQRKFAKIATTSLSTTSAPNASATGSGKRRAAAAVTTTSSPDCAMVIGSGSNAASEVRAKNTSQPHRARTMSTKSDAPKAKATDKGDLSEDGDSEDAPIFELCRRANRSAGRPPGKKQLSLNSSSNQNQTPRARSGKSNKPGQKRKRGRPSKITQAVRGGSSNTNKRHRESKAVQGRGRAGSAKTETNPKNVGGWEVEEVNMLQEEKVNVMLGRTVEDLTSDEPLFKGVGADAKHAANSPETSVAPSTAVKSTINGQQPNLLDQSSSDGKHGPNALKIRNGTNMDVDAVRFGIANNGRLYNPAQEYQVEKILASRTDVNGAQEYLIKWQDYADEFNTWEPEGNIASDLIRDYLRKCQKQVHEVRGLNGEMGLNALDHHVKNLHSQKRYKDLSNPSSAISWEHESSSFSRTSSHLLNKAKGYFLGLGGVLTKLAEMRDGIEAEATIKSLSKENCEIREKYYEKQRELEQALREILELQARLDKCTRDSAQKCLVGDRYELLVKRQFVDKIKYLQKRVSSSLATISQLEAKVKALSSIWFDRWKEGQIKMRNRAEETKALLAGRDEELKRTKIELHNSKTISKALKSMMEIENKKLKAEITRLKMQMAHFKGKNIENPDERKMAPENV